MVGRIAVTGSIYPSPVVPRSSATFDKFQLVVSQFDDLGLSVVIVLKVS